MLLQRSRQVVLDLLSWKRTSGVVLINQVFWQTWLNFFCRHLMYGLDLILKNENQTLPLSVLSHKPFRVCASSDLASFKLCLHSVETPFTLPLKISNASLVFVMWFCFHAHIWLYLWGRFLKTGGKKEKHKSHTFVRRIAVAILHNGWYCTEKLKMRQKELEAKKAWKRRTEREGKRPSWSMFGSFVELYIFTTSLTGWSFKEVKDAHDTRLHVWINVSLCPNVARTTRTWCVVSTVRGVLIFCSATYLHRGSVT